MNMPPNASRAKPADLLWGAAVEQEHRVAAAQQLQRAHQACKSGADNDHIGLPRSRQSHPWRHLHFDSSGLPEASALLSPSPSSSALPTTREFTP